MRPIGGGALQSLVTGARNEKLVTSARTVLPTTVAPGTGSHGPAAPFCVLSSVIDPCPDSMGIVNASRGSVVPYVTGGVGAQTLFQRAPLEINDTDTFFTSNVGGGVKWYSGRWGLRGDYRFIVVQSKDDAPAFFGQETRYGHRVYGGVILNVVK